MNGACMAGGEAMRLRIRTVFPDDRVRTCRGARHEEVGHQPRGGHMKGKRAALAVIMCAVLGIVQGTIAQTTTGEISGRITDSAGAIVRGAEVIAVNEDTGVE